MSSSLAYARCLAHQGEEPPLSCKAGSGTVFLTGCSGACIFCQNFQISHLLQGNEATPQKMALAFLELQRQGCSNINWVSPTPHLPGLLESLAIAIDEGLTLPLVYNTNGYMLREVVETLDGIVDIYLPDMKYGEDLWAETFSAMPGYVHHNQEAITEMIKQVGSLKMAADGAAIRGVIVRHLVLPNGFSGSRKLFRMLASIDPSVHVSVMAQYKPLYQAIGDPDIGRRITKTEYLEAMEAFFDSGLTEGFFQNPEDLEKEDSFFPDFTKETHNIFGSSS